MSYPLIILGAGASFDSLENHTQFGIRKKELDQWKPPLTNQIFDPARFSHILDRNPEAKYFDGEATRINDSYSLEDLMTDILDKRAFSDPRWYQRLMSFRLYLHELFTEISKKYFDRRSNYYRLLSDLELYTGNRAFFVNFNYDLLLEKNIFENLEDMTNVDEYIEGSLKVLKIHGACNWFRFAGNGYSADSNFQTGKKFLINNAKKIFEFENTNGNVDTQFPKPTIKNISSPDWELYEQVNNGFDDNEVKYYVPDLALPVHKKRDHVCPDSHIESLKRQFQFIDRIIIIGWKAADEFLLNFLKDLVGNRPVFIVSPDSADEIAERLTKKYNFKTIPINRSFTEFMKLGDCAKILSASNLDVLIQNTDFNGHKKAKIIDIDDDVTSNNMVNFS